MILAVVFGCVAPAFGARPLLDSGKWNAYFALFARDTQVPWKPVTVRLDTYSGAPVDLRAYEVDPADVLVAGANARPRPIDTAHRRAVVQWRFTPPAGLKFESNDVAVPLGGREGFFVVEARRGDASQQVWLNLSRVGLLTKESPSGIVIYAADLQTGRALPGMRITYLNGTAFVYGKTGSDGVARVTGPRPRFALAEWGHSYAFVNFVPVPPVPAAVVGVRLDRGVIHAGETLQAVGFVRSRHGVEMRPAAGSVKLTLVVRGRTLVSAAPKLDAAGAFSAPLTLPRDAPPGDAVVLAAAAGATGGAALHLQAVGDAALEIAADCGVSCAPDAEIPVRIAVTQAGAPLQGRDVRVRVVRTPHVLPPGTPDDAVPWATTPILDQRLRSDATGAVTVTLPAPADGLASTYGITAESGGASTSTRLVTPAGKIALAVTPERADLNVGEAAEINVRGFNVADGAPAAGTAVTVQLAHGPNVAETRVTLDAAGRGRATFRTLVPGTSLVTAAADVDGRHVLDAAAVAVQPSAVSGGGAGRSGEVRIDFDAPRVAVNGKLNVTGSLAGAVGDALITCDGVRSFAVRRVAVRDSTASASLVVPATIGDVAAGVAFVRDGALYYGTRPIVVDGPGHPRATLLHADRQAYDAGGTAAVTIDDGGSHDAATVAVRLGDGIPAQGADFVDAPDSLASAGTTSQDPASDDPAWHAWVAPAHSTAGNIFAFDRPRAAERVDASLAAAAPRALVWRVDQSSGPRVEVTLPQQKGKYVLSILKMTADGDVGAASIALTVQ